MTKKEKIASLAGAMKESKREDDTGYYHFTDSAPEELKELYLKDYNIVDLDYETFSRAVDIVDEIYADTPDISDDDATDRIYENSDDSASYYTGVRLSYLNNNNEEEVSELMREYQFDSIAMACAQWYDNQVEQQAIIIKDWINA